MSTTPVITPIDQVRLKNAPLLRAPEEGRSIFRIFALTACLPLIGGIIFFGWRAAWVVGLSVLACVLLERFYFRVTHDPALRGRSHAYLTGLLLGLTLPAFTPWYVVLLAAAFAILIGKAVFGGVGHFLWQPALVGRFAVAVIMPVFFAVPAIQSLQPDRWPILAGPSMIFGNVNNAEPIRHYNGYNQENLRQEGADVTAYAVEHPMTTLRKATLGDEKTGKPVFSAISQSRKEISPRQPVLLMALPPMSDLIFGCRGGDIGEASVLMILLGGMYLIFRHYVKWQLPVSFLLAGAIVAAVAPLKLQGVDENSSSLILWPIINDAPEITHRLDVGLTYIFYQLLSGQMMLAAFFLAPEMTSRPVTTSGQALFGGLAGALAMILQLYTTIPIPAYLAVLVFNTLTPSIDMLWRPRVYGQPKHPFLARLLGRIPAKRQSAGQ